MVSDAAISRSPALVANKKPGPPVPAPTSGKSEVWDMYALLKHFEPVEWELTDCLNLIVETLDMDGLDLVTVPQEIRDIENYAFRDVQAVSFNSNPRLTDARVLGKLNNLMAINMWSTGLTTVPETWSHLTRLVFLGMGRNPRIEDWTPLTGLRGLQWLDVGGCALERIPEPVYEMRHLVVLALGGNPGIEVDERKVSRFTKLRRLALNDCELAEVPQGVYELTTLRRLHLDDNPDLLSFSQSVLKLKHLQQLTVSGCDQVRFPKLMSQMDSVREIVVGDDFNVRQGTSFSLRHKLKRVSDVIDPASTT